MLDRAASAYVNSPRGVSFDDGEVVASKIYSWFREDFGGSENAVLDHLKRYAGSDLVNKLARAQRTLMQELGREPTITEIAQELELEPQQVTELRRIAQDPVSLETPLGEEDDSTLGDFVEDTDADVPVEVASFKLLQEYLSLVLEGLNERERQVLIMRFGLADGKVKTLEEVGSHFNVTRERIRQIETKALAKLRQPARAKRLEGYLEGA